MKFQKIILALILVSLISIYFPHATATYYFGNCPHLSNPVPARYEEDVAITAKGVQTCIDITIDPGCVANVTFQWMNTTEYWDAVENWWINNLPWSAYPDPEDYFHNYSNWSLVSHSQTLCAWNANVTCYTEGAQLYGFEWRVIANFTCGGQYSEEMCYYFFYPEECELFYIYPAVNASNVCPCCDHICVGVNNAEGHTMNFTFYRNHSQFNNFYIVNQLNYVNNGTYCFCIDGHINNSIFYPVLFNTTYSWYINVTDTVTGEYNVSDIFFFTTEDNVSNCPCGLEALNESLIELGIEDKIKDDVWILGVAIVFAMIPLGISVRRRRK